MKIKIFNILKSNLLFFILLTIVVFTLYGKSINFDFTYHDDNSLILKKSEFLSDIKNIPKIFTTSCYYSKEYQYYRPILNLSFLIETCICGCNPKIYHLTNIILFILTLYLMYVFLLKLKLSQTILKFVILLFSVHPVLTSTVVWIPARNDTLLAIFIFFSFIFFTKYLEDNNLQNLVLYILFWTISLFTKETAILVLILYPLFMYCFNYKLSKKEIIKNISILISIILVYFCLRNISVAKVNTSDYFINSFVYFNNMLTGISTYLLEIFVPYNIPIMLYKIRLNFINIVVDLSIIFILVVLFYKNVVHRKKIIFFIVLFFVCVFTTFLLQDYVYLNHRIILSLSGIVAIFTYCIDIIIKKYNKLSICFLVLFALLAIILFPYSFNQQDKYKNKNIYRYSVYANAPNYHVACYWMYNLYLENNDLNKLKEFLSKAINDGFLIYTSDLALIYYKEGNYSKAEQLYNQSIELGINRAQCYRNLSIICYKKDNDINKAIEYAKLAINEDPNDIYYQQYLQQLEQIGNKIERKNN